MMEREGMEAEACQCDWYDYPEFYHQSKPVARVQHKCEECGDTIEPRQRYERVVGKWDGVFRGFKTCLPCAQMRIDFCGPHGDLRGHLWELFDFDYREKVEEDDDELEA